MLDRLRIYSDAHSVEEAYRVSKVLLLAQMLFAREKQEKLLKKKSARSAPTREPHVSRIVARHGGSHFDAPQNGVVLLFDLFPN